MEIKELVKKFKGNKYAPVATATVGALMIGVGITGAVMSPSYTYVVGNVSGNLGSKGAAEAFIKENIDHEDVTYRDIGNGYLILEDNWSDYVYSIYKGVYGDDTTFLTDEEVVEDSTGLVTSTVTPRTESDYVAIYKTSTGTISFVLADTIDTFIKSIDKYSNSFIAGSSYESHFDSAAEAEQDWEDRMVATNTFNSRVEYQYDGSTWETTEAVARDALITAEEATITHTAAIAATPGTESDYLASVDYTTSRDLWISDNTPGEAGYLASTEYISERDAWITANAPAVEADYQASTEFSVNRDQWITNNTPDEAAYQASAEYTLGKDLWISSNPDFGNTEVAEYWTYKGTDYHLQSSLISAVITYVDSQRVVRTRHAHDGTNYDYDTETDAEAAYRATLTPAGQSTTVTFFYSEGDIEVSHNDDESLVRNSIENNLSISQGFATATGNFDDYEITELNPYNYPTSATKYYTSKEAIVIAFETDSNIQYTEVTKELYYLEGTEAKFETEEECINFWTEQIKRIKE